MPGHGPPPKDPSKRARTNTGPREELLILAEDGELRGPELPAAGFWVMQRVKLPQGGYTTEFETYDWPEATQRWYEHWRRSAVAQTFLDSDWDFLQETAVLHARFWMGDAKAAAEMRLRVSKFGATPEDRLRLRLQIEQTPRATPEQRENHKPKSRQKYGELRIAS